MEPILIIVGIVFLLILGNKVTKKMPSKAIDLKLSAKWKETLNDKVPFYQDLSSEDKTQFENRVQDFLEEVKITGVNCEVEELDRLLVASSAVIPVFNFPTWKYYNLKEVLLYPKPFNYDFEMEGSQPIQGMVGNGFMGDKMILSRTSLRLGFQAEKDKKNVGIHEFVHLIDSADGSTDGIPKVLMGKQYALPWIDLMHQKIKEMIHGGDTDINLYGATNKQEFLAVVSEYFFEHPEQLKKKHPELFEMLKYFFGEKE
jgi:Mlc titration factor MtfA (ptsG expression regulator)